MKFTSDKIDNSATDQGKLKATEWNNKALETEKVVTIMGVTLDGASTTQLAEGIDYLAKMQIYVDSGGVNTLVASNRGEVTGVEQPNLKTNMSVKIIVKSTNTGASTLNYNGFGVIPVIDETGVPLTSGALIANKMYEFYFNGGSWVATGNPVTVFNGSGRPSATTNPSGVGAIWVDTATGQGYVCTDATKNANVWKNITDVRHYDLLTPFDLNEEVLSDEGVFYRSLISQNSGSALTDTLKWYQLTSKPLLASVTVNVPADYPNVTKALEFLARCYYPISGNISAKIMLGAGYQMNEQVFVIGLNLGWISLVGADAITVTDANQYVLSSPSNLKPLFFANHGATLPVIGQAFDMINGTSANGNHGFLIENNSHVIFDGAVGVKNCGGSGLVLVFTSSATGAFLNFDGANVDGLSVAHGSTASCLYSSFRNCGRDGVAFTGSAIGTIQGSNCTGAGGYGIVSRSASSLNAVSVSARKGGTDSSSDCRVTDGGTISFSGGTGGTNIATNTLTASGIIFK